MPSTKSKLKPRPSAELRFEAIGTQWFIALYDIKIVPAPLLSELRQRIEIFDQQYSRFRSDSLVSTMGRRAGEYRLPADARPLFDMYEELYSLTDGAVTPLIGQVLVDAGYDAIYSFKGKPLQPPPRWEDVMSYQFPILTLKKAALLDLGAIGKGYLIDIIAECLEAAGITAYLIDAGGDMKHHDDSAPAQIGLEHPLKRDEVIGTLQLQNQSLCGSAGNRRAWGNYHHIMDPTSLLPANNILAVWVIADTTLLADALATSLFFISPKLLQKQYTFAYAIVHADQSLERSTDFPAHFF